MGSNSGVSNEFNDLPMLGGGMVLKGTPQKGRPIGKHTRILAAGGAVRCAIWGNGCIAMSKHVLILDDNADNRQLLFFALKTRDYHIYQAGLSQEAQTLVEKTPIDLALLDIELPDGDGLELAEEIRGRNPDAVLVMLSANDSIDLLEHARVLGANAYVVKPFNLSALLGFIQRVDDKVITSASKMQML